MTWFYALSSREKIMIMALMPLALIAALYQFGWVPLNAARDSYIDQIAAYRLVADTAQLAAQSATLDVAAPVSPQQDIQLATRITTSSEAAGVVLRRIEPEGDGIRVTLADTSFTQLTLWLAEMEMSYAVLVAAIEIDRRPEPGTVSARILLEDL